MRLIDTFTYELHDSGDKAVAASPDYAILSHRWQPPEVTLQTFNPVDLCKPDLPPQLDKIRQACAIARQREVPIRWLWVDTCCIDKTNAVEEARSINSMFAWYRRATVCLAYLHDVDVSVVPRQSLFASESPNRWDQTSEWFERGWTLQELLAPETVEFYDSNWGFFGTKRDLADQLELATGISQKYLTGDARLDSASVATRMSWMGGRTATMIEDIAYSMLGILQVSMSPQYGEGVQAFMRLQKILIESSTDESIFAWTTPSDGLMCYRGLGKAAVQWAPESWGLLAPSPDCFAKDRELVIVQERVRRRLRDGYRWTQYGVHFEMPMPWISWSWDVIPNLFGYRKNKKVHFALNCWIFDHRGRRRTIQVHLLKKGDLHYRVRCSELGQSRCAKPDTKQSPGHHPYMTQPLIVEQPVFNPMELVIA